MHPLKIVFSTVSRKAGGLCQFDPPYGPSLVERAFEFDEGGGGTAENPHMAVWRLLPCYTRNPERNMLNAIVHFSLRFRGIVIALACALLGYGAYSLSQARYDVFPELAPPQVVRGSRARSRAGRSSGHAADFDPWL